MTPPAAKEPKPRFSDLEEEKDAPEAADKNFITPCKRAAKFQTDTKQVSREFARQHQQPKRGGRAALFDLSQQKKQPYNHQQAPRESLLSSPTNTADDKKNPGLKLISQSVMHAVTEKGTTTYKQVAEIVSKKNENNPQIFDSSSCGSHSKKHNKQQNQEKNLRRRVYDSLNVLYAVGVLQKGQNKQVFCSAEYDQRSRGQAQDEIQKMEARVKQGCAGLQEKSKRLQDMMLQQISYKYMIKRNRKAEEKRQEALARVSKQGAPEAGDAQSNIRIHLPFLLMTISDQPGRLIMNEYNDRRLELSSSVPMQVYGDADVLGMLGFGRREPDMIREFLGEDFAEVPDILSDVRDIVKR